MKEGSLNIVIGDTFSAALHNGDSAEYEITDGILYLENSRSRDVVLTLPEGESYETMELEVKDGHVRGEGTLKIRNLNLSAERSEVDLPQLYVEETASVKAEQGTVLLNGYLGADVDADCRQGHVNLVSGVDKDSYNYVLEVEEGKIHLDDKEYHGKSFSDQVDNGAERTMTLKCSRGDIAVEFRPSALPDIEND